MASKLSSSGAGAPAAACEVPVEALRFYERARLLPAGTPSPGAAGAVPPRLEQRLRFIDGARELGFSLAEIRELLALNDDGMPSADQGSPVLEHLIEQLDDKLVELMRLRRVLLRLREAAPKSAALHGESILAVLAGNPDA